MNIEKLPDPAKLPQEFILDAFADPASVREVVRGILHTIFFHRYFPTLSPRTHEVLDLTLPYVAEPELETLIDQRTAALVHELDATSSSKTGASVPAPTPASAVPPSISAASAVGANTTTPASLSTSPAAPSSPSRSPARKAQHQHHQSLPQQGRAALAGLLGAAAGVGEKRSSGGGGGGGRGQVSVQFMEKTTSRRRKMWGRADEEVCWEVWTVRVTVAEPRTESERAKVRKAMGSTLLTTVMKIITSVNTYKEHIPPIMTTEANPFPYSINVNQKEVGLGGGGGGGWAGRFGGLY